MNEITGFNDKLRFFKEAAERIDKELSQFLAYSETMLAEMLDKIPERDYSVDTSKEVSEQFQKIRDKIYEVSQKMLVRRHKIWEILYKREQGLLNEYLALCRDLESLPMNSYVRISLTKSAKEKIRELEIYTTLQKCWGMISVPDIRNKQNPRETTCSRGFYFS